MIWQILIIMNTLTLIYLILSKKSNLYLTLKKQTTFYKKTVVGYNIILWKKMNEYSANGIWNLYIPIKNKMKVELKEEIDYLIKSFNQIYLLRAKFSWLKTLKEVKQFEKDYSIVNKELVQELVSKFREGNK